MKEKYVLTDIEMYVLILSGEILIVVLIMYAFGMLTPIENWRSIYEMVAR